MAANCTHSDSFEEFRETLDFCGVALPDEFHVESVDRNLYGETNDVFYCRAILDGTAVGAYVKVGKDPQLSLSNECAVLASNLSGLDSGLLNGSWRK